MSDDSVHRITPAVAAYAFLRTIIKDGSNFLETQREELGAALSCRGVLYSSNKTFEFRLVLDEAAVTKSGYDERLDALFLLVESALRIWVTAMAETIENPLPRPVRVIPTEIDRDNRCGRTFEVIVPLF